MKITFVLNKKEVCVDVEPAKPLLRVLREELGIKSVKEGCGRGECGTCTILINDKAVTGCMVAVAQVRGRNVMTLEGLEEAGVIQPVQDAFVLSGSVQCGFCIPGFIISAYALLKENPSPTRNEIKIAVSGNICRCTGYTKIIDGIEMAGELMR